MLRPEQDDHAEEAGLQELIEQFEAFLEKKEYSFFDDDALERLYEYYENRLDEGHMEAVADLAIAQNPYSGDFLVRKAELLFNRKDYQASLELLDKAVVFDATNLDIYLLRSEIMVESNRIEEALELLRDALRLADREEKDVILTEISDVFEIQEDFHAAFDCLRDAIKHNPSNEAALMKIAHLAEMTDRFDDSLDIHLAITEEHPYNWMAWYNAGRAYAGLGLYEKALDAFEFTMAIQEDFDLVYRDVADIYFRLEDLDKAISTFETAQEKSGGFEDYSFRIGMCYERKNDLKKARFHYRKSTRQDPYLDEAFFRIAETYRQEDRFEPALVNYKKALRIDETNELYMTCIIAVYRMLGREEEVLQYLQRLTQARPDILNYWLDLLIFRWEHEQFEAGLENVQEATERCGHFVEFDYLRSLLLWYAGQQQESLRVLAQALDTDKARHTILLETDPSFLLKEAVMRVMNAQ